MPKKQQSIRLDDVVARRLINMSEDTGLNQSEVIEQAIMLISDIRDAIDQSDAQQRIAYAIERYTKELTERINTCRVPGDTAH